MIQANELRVGNIVHDEDGAPMYIAGLWPVINGYNFKDSAGNSGPVNLLQPIPLTSDILLKAGFEKDDSLYKWTKIVEDESKQISVEIDTFPNREGFFYLAKIEYVHQLQNLYWCLCGKELDIKL